MATQRQKKVAEKLLENTRLDNPKPIGHILVEAGYSEGTAITPSQVTQSKGFKECLIEAGVDDDKLARIIDEGLEANKLYFKGNETVEAPDWGARHRFVETSLKIKEIVSEKSQGNTYNTFVQQNNINPNAPKARDLSDAITATLMERTKRE